MENQSRNFCNPCRCSTTNSKLNYFYSESIPVRDNAPQKLARSRPSSANSVKSSRSNKKTLDTSKNAASDSKILKQNFPSKIKPLKNKKRPVDSACTEQLKEDLRVIKEQLFLLSERKQESVTTSKDIEVNSTSLKEQCENQEEEIKELKNQNAKLVKKLKKQKSQEEENIQNAITAKSHLDEYEEKLSSLYDEFLETTKFMEQSREKMCRCIKQKTDEYESMMNAKDDALKPPENAIPQLEVPETLPESKDNENKFAEMNADLTQTLAELQNELHQARDELEKSHKQASIQAKKHRREITEKDKAYQEELQNKSREIEELKAKVQTNNPRGCRCNPCKHKLANTANMVQTQYDQLHHKYKHVVNKLNLYQQTNKRRTEELQVLKQHESDLLTEYVNLQSFCVQLRKIISGHNVTMAKLNSSLHEKDATIKCQAAELGSKNKQVDLLLKNEDRLKKKVIDLQEDVVSMRIASTSGRSGYGQCPEDCSIHLTEELEDLINALYEEIDKTLEKDEEIQKQAREICCLKCAMSAKDKELRNIRIELKTLQHHFTTTVNQKEASRLQEATMHVEDYGDEELCK